MRIDPIWLGVGGMWLGLALGCPSPDFVCQSNGDCAAGSEPGLCEDNGYCSFPDEACPSGQRYGELSGPLSGQCTTPNDESTTSASSSTAMGSASGGPGTSSSSSADATSDTNLASTGAISDVTSSESGAPTVDATSIDPTAMGGSTSGLPGDPYGPCTDGCNFEGAICLMTNQGESVCASPCMDPFNPAESCPVPLVEGYAVGCASTQMGGGDFCVLLCADGGCPGGMFCRPPVCVFE